MGSPLVNLEVSNLLVVHLFLKLTGQRITGLSYKQTVGQSQPGIPGSWTIFSSRIERVLLGQ